MSNHQSEEYQANIQSVIDSIAAARRECKLVMIGIENTVDHGEPAAQVIVFRDRTPADGLMAVMR